MRSLAEGLKKVTICLTLDMSSGYNSIIMVISYYFGHSCLMLFHYIGSSEGPEIHTHENLLELFGGEDDEEYFPPSKSKATMGRQHTLHSGKQAVHGQWALC
jgi:hypothetical protein